MLTHSVVDRSGSIARVGEWNYVVDFVKAIVNKLTFGTTGVYLGISSFNHDVWVTLTMAEVRVVLSYPANFSSFFRVFHKPTLLLPFPASITA